ncbi:MAG: MBL fold metallo-hydrolase [Clostridia bacterium]|nr:MBL fold metallo-hydrolase [Clostridia bacterium]
MISALKGYRSGTKEKIGDAVLFLIVTALSVLLLYSCGKRGGEEELSLQPDTAEDVSGTAEETSSDGERRDYGFTAPEGYEFYCEIMLGSPAKGYVFKSLSRELADRYVEEYLSVLAGEGWRTVDRREAARYLFVCLTDGEDALHLSFDRTARRLRVIKDKASRSVYSLEDSLTGEREATLIQLDNDHTNSDVGMGYVICLKDGRYVLIDGGHSCDSEAELIWETLASHSGGEKPVIAMWIVSHPHADHAGAFRRFAELHGKDVKLQALCVNDAVAYVPYNGEKAYSAASYAAFFDGARTVSPQTGDLITVGGVTFEFLYTFTDYYPSLPACLNNTSLVVRASAGLSAIFLGDIQTEAGNFLASMYGDHLKSDILQFAHHGYRNGASAEVYSFIGADIGLWPSSSSLYESLKDTAPAGKTASGMKKVVLSDLGSFELSLEKAGE